MTEQLNQEQLSIFSLVYRVTKFAKFGLVKGRTFAKPAAHPHPNCMGVPPLLSFWSTILMVFV